MLAGQGQEQFGGALGFVVAHAGNRLVQQQQPRFLHQQHADFQPLLLAVRQQARRAAGLAGQVDQRQRFGDAVALCRVQAREQAAAHALVGLHRQFEVFEHRVVLEHGRLLELAADAGVGDLGFAQSRQVDRLAEENRPLVGPRLAGDDVHHRGLAGAVGPDDAAQFADVDHQRQRVQGA